MFDVILSTVHAFSQIRLGPWRSLGNILLVGEGNLSFAKSLLRLPTAQVTRMTATTYETEESLSAEAQKNATMLRHCGAFVLHGIDATYLEQNFKPNEFETIVFQFPNVGSREAKHGHNPNHVMIRKFLRNATSCLTPSGKILISAVDSPHYQGTFRFDEAAEFAGYETPETFPFDPSMFPGYSHTNTNDDKSALDDHDRFATWIFKLKA
jgi:25S rRNA (uracil2634-N3)-methyltransferase